MRKAVLVAVVGWVMQGAAAEACSPQPDEMYVQPSVLGAVMRSQEIYSKLREQGAREIQTIAAVGGSWLFTATNGCSVKARAIWSQPEGGLCPSMLGVEVGEVSCR